MFTLEDTPLQCPSGDACPTGVGAVVLFQGRVRDRNDGRAVRALAYEAYQDLAVAEGRRIIEEALNRFDILAARCAHRVGHLQIGDLAVWVEVHAAHRSAAFEASAYIIDEVKARVPIWKKELYEGGDSGWVNCQERTRPLPA